MRLDKYLAHAQLGTRKEVKKLIRSKRVRVNDEDVYKRQILCFIQQQKALPK